MKRLDGLKGMSYDENEQKWKRHCEEAWEMAAWDGQHAQIFPGF